MIWIVLVLALLCIVMSCVALWYRDKWNKEKESYCNMSDMYYEMKEKYNREYYECNRLLISIGDLNIEVDNTKDKLRQKELQCDVLREENEKKCEEISMLRDEFKRLHQQLPKRDSKGRFCKK